MPLQNEINPLFVVPFSEGNSKFNWAEDKDMYSLNGVYYLYKSKEDAENDKPVYIGEAPKQPLARTIQRHFQQWNDKAQIRRISYSPSADWHFAFVELPKGETTEFQDQEILRYTPEDNKYFANVWTGNVQSLIDAAAKTYVNGTDSEREFINDSLFTANAYAFSQFEKAVAKEETAKLAKIQEDNEAAEAAEVERIRQENIFLSEEEAKRKLQEERDEQRKKRNKKIKKESDTPF
jgi:hypothetical protein